MLKKALFSLICLTLLFGAASVNAAETNLAEQLSGRILLQVEELGEAWYVSPENHQRYFLGSPYRTLQVMSSLGLGISHADLQNFLQSEFPERLSGKILLDVNDLGRAYYINPLDMKAYSLGSPEQALHLLRELGLGITNEDLAKITSAEQEETSAQESNDYVILKEELKNQIKQIALTIFESVKDVIMEESLQAGVSQDEIDQFLAEYDRLLAEMESELDAIEFTDEELQDLLEELEYSQDEFLDELQSTELSKEEITEFFDMLQEIDDLAEFAYGDVNYYDEMPTDVYYDETEIIPMDDFYQEFEAFAQKAQDIETLIESGEVQNVRMETSPVIDIFMTDYLDKNPEIKNLLYDSSLALARSMYSDEGLEDLVNSCMIEYFGEDMDYISQHEIIKRIAVVDQAALQSCFDKTLRDYPKGEETIDNLDNFFDVYSKIADILTAEFSALQNPDFAEKNIRINAQETMSAARNFDIEKLASIIHPEKGLYIFLENSLITPPLNFSPNEIRRYGSTSETFSFVSPETTDYYKKMTFSEFWGNYVYDADYANALHTSYNESKSFNDVYEYASQYFPYALTAEYYLTQLDQYGLEQEKILYFHFEEYEGSWYLTGISKSTVSG